MSDFSTTYAKPFAAPRLPFISATACLAFALASCGGGGTQSGSTASTASTGLTGTPASGGTDYSVVANWVCRPGSDAVCTQGLDANIENANGSTASQPFTAAADPPIDCFYVYPTVSQETTYYADLTDSPEVQTITRAQVGRLSSRCRVFAPIYRQVTSYGLNHPSLSTQPDLATLDVQAAWNYYLKNDNQGRGVVIIGHSQGTILLQRLIAASI